MGTNPWILRILGPLLFALLYCCNGQQEQDAELIHLSGDPRFSRIAPPNYNAELERQTGFRNNYAVDENKLRQEREKLLYPFFDEGGGRDNVGDYQLGIRDNSPQITKSLNFLLPFFGFGYNYTWVSMHGYLSFSDGPELTNYPLVFPVPNYPNQSDPSFIGPFYSKCKIGELRGDEVDPRRSGVYFRLEQGLIERRDEFGSILRERLKRDIREGIVGAEQFEPRHAIIVTWKNVTFAGGTIYARRTTNTFQLVLGSDETRTYAIFNYALMEWTAHPEAGSSTLDGNFEGVSAFIGFNAGNGTRAFEYLPYSQTDDIKGILTGGHVNGHPGRHIFRIDEKIMPGQCVDSSDVSAHKKLLSFAPESGNMLGGTIVNVTGPCFDETQRIKCRFNTFQVPGIFINKNQASCVMPRIYITGYIDISVEIEGSNDLLWKGKFFVETPEQAPELVSFNKEEILAKEPTQISVYWDYKNLTMDRTALVSISLWGYREITISPEIIFIESIAVGVSNEGFHSFNPQEFSQTNTPWARDIQIGLVSVNLTDLNEPAGTIYQPVIWSRPIPLAWRMWPQWEEKRGRWEENMCEEWIDQDRLLKNYASELPICPCTLEQAIADKGRFLQDHNCDKDGKVLNCYLHEGAKHCVRSAMPSQSGAGQQCCYDVHSSLMMTQDSKWGARPSRSHDFGLLPWNEASKVPSLSHYLHDVAPFFPCCMWQPEQSWWCMTYRFERRQSQNCVGYQPPAIAAVFGDPHIYTFDGSMYTFNGKGEYVLVRADTDSHKFDVQARFEQPPRNTYGQPVRATVLTALAAKAGGSAKVEIRLRPLDARWRYKLDVFVDEHRIFFDRHPQKIQTFLGLTVYTPTNIQNQSHVVAMFESGAGVEVIENAGHLTARVYLPNTFLGQVRGLFGNYSGLTDDDFMLPDGSMGPTVNLNNFNTMHQQFGRLWALDTTESNDRGGSLFYYENERTGSSYADRFFVPEMRSDPAQIIAANVSLRARLVEVFCGNSYQCKYDYSVTLNKGYAEWCKYYQAQFLALKEGPLQPIISCGPLMTPIHGRKSNFLYTPGTEIQFDCDPDFVLVGDRRRICQENGEWNVPKSREDERTETEWHNFNPSKGSRCVEEGEHNATASGLVAAIILGIIFFILLILLCFCVCSRRMKRNEPTDSVPGFGERDPPNRKARPSGGNPLMMKHAKKGSDAVEHRLHAPKKIKKEDIVILTSAPPLSPTRSSPPSTSSFPDQTNFPPVVVQKHEHEPYSRKSHPSENETSSDESTHKPTPASVPPPPPPPQQVIRTRPDPLGQSRSRKPLLLPADGVYFTGEPLPNRPSIDFSDEEYDQEPKRIVGQRLSSSSDQVPSQRSLRSTSSLDSDTRPPLPSVPPPPRVQRPQEYDGEPYISNTISV